MAQAPDIFALMQRAEAAQMLLEHTILKEVLERLRQEAMEALLSADATDLPRYQGQIATIHRIRDELQTIINDPKLAVHSTRMKQHFGDRHGRAERR